MRPCAGAAAVWNIFLKERPDFARTAAGRIPALSHARRPHWPVPGNVALKIPVFTADPDHLLHCTFIAELATSGVEKGGERWTPLGREALDFFDAVTKREEVSLDMNIERGDIRFLNKRTTIHAFRLSPPDLAFR